MSFVLDSSATLGWVYVDEKSPTSLQARQQILRSGAWVTSIWRLEIANSLQHNIKRGRIDILYRDRVLADLAELNILMDMETDAFAWTTTLALANRFGLTTYDACYLELAQRRGLALATLDADLRKAALAAGVPLLGA